MCISMAKADFRGTKICINATRMPNEGIVHVLMYQNEVANLGVGPNAMLLHIPAEGIGQRNFIDTRKFSSIMDDMVTAVTPRSRDSGAKSMGFSRVGGSRVQVFDVGIYTIILAEKASDIPAALNRVPQGKRPKVNRELFAFYEQAFPGYAVALCCFNNQRSVKAEPIMVWYKPLKNTDGMYRFPAIDCHTGGVPDLTADVEVDHWLFLAADGMRGGSHVTYSEAAAIKPEVHQLLPKRVYGAYFRGPRRNGDFGVRQPEDLSSFGSNDAVLRLPPPGFRVAA
ncbi:MAG: hypothetical protein HY455_01175 [Parcubacteria group bacterium]|nr:hypothetical protein [Parcubacteria group bacterium]